jgi:hypothetical protein
MARIRGLSILGALVLMASATTSAQQPPESQAEAHQRGKPSAVDNASPKSAWSIVEGKSPTDNSLQFSAGLVVGDAALILRCREQHTEAAFSTKNTYLGDKSATVRFRINFEEPVKEVWPTSIDGRAAFAPNPVDFIRALPDNGRIFIRAVAADGKTKDANFKLSGVSEIRDKIDRTCKSPGMPDESTGATKPSQGR